MVDFSVLDWNYSIIRPKWTGTVVYDSLPKMLYQINVVMVMVHALGSQKS